MSHLPALSASKNADVASSTATLKHMKLGRSYPRRWLLFLFLGFLSGDLRQLVPSKVQDVFAFNFFRPAWPSHQVSVIVATVALAPEAYL